MKLNFSDVFHVSEHTLTQYGAFNISVVNDLPLFIDPFLIFNSDKPEYQQLHAGMIKYLEFLRELSEQERAPAQGLISALYRFQEVKQNWLGYSVSGNSGRGLGFRFAYALNKGLRSIFSSFGSEKISRGSHLEKLCLFDDGIGRDSISDFTTNLIKEFLLKYTQEFAKLHIDPALRDTFHVEKVSFNYETHTWKAEYFNLPRLGGSYVLLTPRDLLSKDRTWIDRLDFEARFETLVDSVPNGQLRDQLSHYLKSKLKKKQSKAEKRDILSELIQTYPAILDYYIRLKEETGGEAASVSSQKVDETHRLFVNQVRRLVTEFLVPADFYAGRDDDISSARDRLKILQRVLKNDIARNYLHNGSKPIKTQRELELFFRLVWLAESGNLSSTALNGRPPRVPVQFVAGVKKLFDVLAPWRTGGVPGSKTLVAICCVDSADRGAAETALENLLPSSAEDVFILDLCEPETTGFQFPAKNADSPLALIPKKRFQVALSFPGEHRPLVSQIAEILAERLAPEQIFYDRFYEAELAIPNLDIHLLDIYRTHAGLLVVFLCKDYERKDWCHLEFRAIRDLIKHRKDDEVMLIRMDDGEVPGILSIDGYVDARNRPAVDIASLIIQRQQQLARRSGIA